MNKPVQKADEQVRYLKERLQNFIDVVDAWDPENIELDDIDSLLQMLDEMEEKCQQIQE